MNETAPADRLTNVALSVDSVGKTFVTRPVLRKVDLVVEKGEAVCLCGVNGAGKSTLLRIIAVLLRRYGGWRSADAICATARRRPAGASG